jgi:hypothetical protein
MNLKAIASAAAFAVVLAASSARADSIPYPNEGVENPLLYTFTATADGDITAYFHGSGASFESVLGLLVNGVDTGITGLNNHTSAVGEMLNFGPVTAGSVLTFYINVDSGDTWYSDKSLNADGTQHIYSTIFSGAGAIPAGTFVAFEDLNALDFTDFNYQDLAFVFTNTTTAVSQTPVPAALPLFAGGLGMIGLLARRRRRT